VVISQPVTVKYQGRDYQAVQIQGNTMDRMDATMAEAAVRMAVACHQQIAEFSSGMRVRVTPIGVESLPAEEGPIVVGPKESWALHKVEGA
jgi:hypothetical protein